MSIQQQNFKRISEQTIEESKQRADIVDVILRNVVLRKRGKDWVDVRPFHQKKTPSFSARSTKQMYYCFGCSAEVAKGTQP